MERITDKAVELWEVLGFDLKANQHETLHIKNIVATLEAALELYDGDLDSARGWLEAPNANLDGQIPLHLLKNSDRVLEVDILIKRLGHGIPT